MYSSLTDVRSALTPGGVSDSSTAASLTDPAITDAIDEADSIIDSYIGSRYGIPQDPNDATVAVKPVRYWSRDIAAFLATLTWKKGKDVGPDEPVRIRYTAVMNLLTAIRDGKATVNLPAPTGDQTGDEVWVENMYDGNLFDHADTLTRRVLRHPFSWGNGYYG